MDLRVGFVVVYLCALAITSTEAGIPKCCISTKNDIPLRVLQRVQRWDIQQNTGACDISALILHVKGMVKPVCANPKLKKRILFIWRMMQNKQRTTF